MPGYLTAAGHCLAHLVQYKHPPQVTALCTRQEVVKRYGDQVWIVLQHELSDVMVIPQLVCVAWVQGPPTVGDFALLTSQRALVAHSLVYKLRKPVVDADGSVERQLSDEQHALVLALSACGR